MAPNGKPASFVMQHQRSPLQAIHDQTAAKNSSIKVKNECILFSQSIMSGRWNPTNNPQMGEQPSTAVDGPEPRVLSKKRRDMINAEIRELQNLLPLKKSARERLSYLGILALTNTFIRKATFFKKECISSDSSMYSGLVPEFSSSLCGFLLVFNRDGKILYSSDNILDYLGNTVVELASQGDSIYEFVDKEDHDQVRAQLEAPPHDDRGKARKLSFYCRMTTSRYMKTQLRSWKNKIVHIAGRYHTPEMSNDWSETVFFAVCTPVESKPITDVRHHPSPRATEFKIVHGPDMKLLEVPNTVESLLGYKPAELEKTSWYQWIHPEDVEQARQQHAKFAKEDGSTLACVVRMIKKDGSVAWVDITAEKSQECIGNSFVCNYIIIDEDEVPYFRLHHNLLPFPEHYTDNQRQYLAYRSTLLSAALNCDVSSATSSPITSPSGICHNEPAHFGLSQQMFGDSVDTKSLLRRQLIKRKMSSIENPIAPVANAYSPEMFTVPPNKMFIRSTSEMPFPTAAYHAPLQHSTSFPETTYHPHMLYRGFSNEESYLSQLHNPSNPSAYFSALAPIHTFNFHPSRKSPLQIGEPVSPVNALSAQRNQSNNIVQQRDQCYPNQYSPVQQVSRIPSQESVYYQQTGSPQSQLCHSPCSPVQQPRPAPRGNKRLSSSIFQDVNEIIDGELVDASPATICQSLIGSSQQHTVQSQCSIPSSYSCGSLQSPTSSYHGSPQHSPVYQQETSEICSSPYVGQCRWSATSCANEVMQPTNLSIHQMKEEALGSPQADLMSSQCHSPQGHPDSPYSHGCGSPSRNSPGFAGNSYPTSSCAQIVSPGQCFQSRSMENKSYQLHYSISSTHPSTMNQNQAALYAAIQQGQRCNMVDCGQDWTKVYGNPTATEMLFSEATGAPYRA